MQVFFSLLVLTTLVLDYVAGSCRVADIPVQPNFDIKQYTGVTWYEQKLLPISGIAVGDYYTDFQHTYYLHPDGKTITSFDNGRDRNNQDECFYRTTEVKTTDVPGKWLIRFGSDYDLPDDDFVDFWIVSTDYTDYSVVYRCVERDSAGACITPNAFIYSRIPQLSNDTAIVTAIDDTLDNLCVNKSALLSTQHTNECPIAKGKDCTIYSIDNKRMKDFELHRFVGKWYETSWLASFYHPPEELYQDYQHTYTTNSDDTVVTVFATGRDPTRPDTCFYQHAQLIPAAEPGKFMYRMKLNSTDFLYSDYWVIRTDYIDYAVVYGCRELDSTGHCTHVQSWIWSRYPAVPESDQTLVDNTMEELCVNTSMYLPTEQNNECNDTRDCSVYSIQQGMVKNLIREDMKGRWYQYSYLPSTQQEMYSDYQMVVTGVSKKSDPDTSVTYTRVRYPNRPGDECAYEEMEIELTDTPGKQRTIRNTPKGNITVTSYLMAVDYTSYYVSYSCLGENEDSKCNMPSASLWSRSTTLPADKLLEAKVAIIGLCMNYDSFVKVIHSNYCPPEDISKGFHLMGCFTLTLAAIWAAIHTKHLA